MLRGADWRNPVVWGLVAANLVPFVGVVRLGWSISLLLVVYWVESGVILWVTCLKMLQAQGEKDPEEFPDTDEFILEWPNWKHVVFSAVFFRLMWTVHGGFVVGLTAQVFPGAVTPTQVASATAGLGLSHLVSYWVEFRRSGAYREQSELHVFQTLSDRIIVAQGTVLVGLLVTAVLGSPLALVGVMVVVKTVVDIRNYRKEHASIEESVSRDTGQSTGA